MLPGLQNAVKALSMVSEKPRNPYLWIANYLEKHDPLAAKAQVTSRTETAAGGPILASTDVLREESYNHVLDTPEDIQGVANFRRSKKNPRIYGVHQPTIAGVRAVVEQLCAEHGKVVWICLRDNPVLYVHGKPYRVHSKVSPHEDSLGIKKACVNNGDELARLERHLMRDVIVRAHTSQNMLQLYSADGLKDGNDVEPEPTPTRQGVISTFQGVFDELEAEGFGVKLHRCLFCADGAPEAEEIEQLVAAVRGAGEKPAIVLSCSDGVERTQVGMLFGTLTLTLLTLTQVEMLFVSRIHSTPTLKP